MAADIGEKKAKNNMPPATEEAFFSKAKQREALAQDPQEEKQSSLKKRDVERARMLPDLKAKAKNGKKQPSFEIVDVSEAERLRGEQVAAYQAKKAQELQQRRA